MDNAEPSPSSSAGVDQRSQEVSDSPLVSETFSASQLNVCSDDDKIDSIFLQPTSRNEFICEACDVRQPRAEFLEHHASADHINKVKKLRNNPAFDLNEVAAYKGARVDVLAELLARRVKQSDGDIPSTCATPSTYLELTKSSVPV